MAVPEPTEVAPWYLRNITQALALDSATGNVYVRTGLTSGANITLTLAASYTGTNCDLLYKLGWEEITN